MNPVDPALASDVARRPRFVGAGSLVEDPQHFACEKIPTFVFERAADASCTVAKEIARLIQEKAEAGETCVLGLATGSTPTQVYGELVLNLLKFQFQQHYNYYLVNFYSFFKRNI